MSRSQHDNYLVCRTAGRLIALPVSHVVETVRALAFEPVAGMPDFMLGLCILRGEAVPVIELQALLGGSAGAEPTRYVVIRSDQRRVALAVDGVEGVTELTAEQRRELPQLLGSDGSSALEAVAIRDQQVLEVLESTRLLPQEFWKTLETQRAHDA